MKRVLIYFGIAILLLLVVNVILATCLYLVELVTGWGTLAMYTGYPQGAVASYFHLTGCSMLVMIPVAFVFIWMGPDVKRYLKKKEGA